MLETRDTGTLAPMRASMRPADANALGQGAATLQRWERQVAAWDAVQRDLAARTGRAVVDTVMNRAETYRAEVEHREELERVKALSEKYGDDVWKMSLRNNRERPVAVGYRHLGLFLNAGEPRRDREPLVRVGRPAGVAEEMGTTRGGGGGGAGMGSTRGARARSWEASGYLEEKERRLARRLAEFRAPPGADPAGLMVGGLSLEEVLWSRADAPVTLADVEAVLEATRRDAWEAWMAERPEPAGDLSLAAPGGADADAGAEGPAAVEGPHVTLDAARVAVEAPVGEAAHARVRLANTGSTALFYEWRARDPAPDETPRAGAGDLFFMPARGGSVLPGQEVDVWVGFRPRAPGVYAREFELLTSPWTPEPLHVLVRGVCPAGSEAHRARDALVADLAARERAAEVASALERMVEDAADESRHPPAPQDVPGWDAADHLAWHRANNGHPAPPPEPEEPAGEPKRGKKDAGKKDARRPASAPEGDGDAPAEGAPAEEAPPGPHLYYWPRHAAALRSAYAAAHPFLAPPPDPKRGALPVPDDLLARFPEECDLSVARAGELADALEAGRAAPEGGDAGADARGALAALRAAAGAARGACALPETRRDLVARAMRGTLLEMVADLEDTGSRLRAEMEAAALKRAEEEAALAREQEAGGDGGDEEARRRAAEEQARQQAEAEAAERAAAKGGKKGAKGGKKGKKDAEPDPADGPPAEPAVEIDAERWRQRVQMQVRRQMVAGAASLPGRIAALEEEAGAELARRAAEEEGRLGGDPAAAEAAAWDRFQLSATRHALLTPVGHFGRVEAAGRDEGAGRGARGGREATPPDSAGADGGEPRTPARRRK